MTHWRYVQLIMVGLLVGPVPACFRPALRRPELPNVAVGDEPGVPASVTQRSVSPYAPGEDQPVAPVTRNKLPTNGLDLPRRPATENPGHLPELSLPGEEGPQTVMADEVETAKPGSSSLLDTRFAGDEKPQVRPPLIVWRDEPALVQAMRCYMEKRPDEAVAKLKNYDIGNQELLLVLLPLTVRMAEGSLVQADPEDMANAVDQLQSVLQVLRTHAPLAMAKLCFCRQIMKFGAYEALEGQPVFRPGELVEVYFEIRNVTCRRVSLPEGEFQTHTKTTLEIKDQAAAYSIRQRPSSRPEPFQSEQHDYCEHWRFLVPPNAPAGQYDLIVEVTDVPTGRQVKQKLGFRVQ